VVTVSPLSASEGLAGQPPKAPVAAKGGIEQHQHGHLGKRVVRRRRAPKALPSVRHQPGTGLSIQHTHESGETWVGLLSDVRLPVGGGGGGAEVMFRDTQAARCCCKR